MHNAGASGRQTISLLASAIIGLAVALLSGLALVPRVRLVEVMTVIAGAVGSGAAFAMAINQYVERRKYTVSAVTASAPPPVTRAPSSRESRSPPASG